MWFNTYLGPYYPLKQPSSYDDDGNKPANALDENAMNHDVCYSVDLRHKSEYDMKMVIDIDNLAYKEISKTVMLTKSIQ